MMRSSRERRLPAETETRSAATEFDHSYWRRAILFLIAIKLAGLILILDPYGLQAFDLPKSVFSRVTAAGLGIAVVATMARFGPGIIPQTRLHIAVAVLFLANIISAIYGANPYLAIFGDQGRYLGLTFLLDMTVLYLAIAIAFRTAEDWTALLASVGTATALASCYAIVQALGSDPITWAKSSNEQPFSTFGHPDIFGHFLSIAFGVSLGIAAAGPSGLSLFRIGSVAAPFAFVMFASLVATRGTLLGIAASLAVFATLKFRERRRRRGALRELALVGATSLAVLLLIMAYTPLGARVTQVLEDEGSGRLSFYDSALRATLARPVFGFGPDNFGVAFPPLREPPPHGPVDPVNSAHNWLLQASATTGVVGLLALVVVIGSFGVVLVRVGLRLLPTVAVPLLLGYVAYWTHALVTVGSIAVDWFPWVCYGVIASIAGERSSRTPSLQRRRFAIASAAVLLVVSLVGVIIPWATFQANRYAGQARVDWTHGLSAEAISAAEIATTLDAGRAEYWNWLGLGRDQAGTPRSAADAFEEATRRAPHEARYWLNLALARARQALAGDDREVAQPAALTAAARAVAADPYAPGFNEALTEIALELGDLDVALRSAVATTLLYEGHTPAAYQAFLIAQRISDLPSARQVLENATAIRETAEFRLALAQIAIRMSDRAAARTNALRALELKPADDDALRLLAQSER